MKEIKWEKGWLKEILKQADLAVQKWPEWMKEPQYRYKFILCDDISKESEEDEENVH